MSRMADYLIDVVENSYGFPATDEGIDLAMEAAMSGWAGAMWPDAAFEQQSAQIAAGVFRAGCAWSAGLDPASAEALAEVDGLIAERMPLNRLVALCAQHREDGCRPAALVDLFDHVVDTLLERHFYVDRVEAGGLRPEATQAIAMYADHARPALLVRFLSKPHRGQWIRHPKADASELAYDAASCLRFVREIVHLRGRESR